MRARRTSEPSFEEDSVPVSQLGPAGLRFPRLDAARTVADSSAAESMKAELRYEFGAVERHHRIKLTFPSGWLTPDLDA